MVGQDREENGPQILCLQGQVQERRVRRYQKAGLCGCKHMMMTSGDVASWMKSKKEGWKEEPKLAVLENGRKLPENVPGLVRTMQGVVEEIRSSLAAKKGWKRENLTATATKLTATEGVVVAATSHGDQG